MSEMINELERVHKELERWRGKAFLLTPYARTQFDSIKTGYRPEFRVTYISPEPADQQVYKLDNQPDKLVLSKIGLQLLDHMAGIRWVRVWNALDPKVDPVDKHFCKQGAEGSVQDLDGAFRNAVCTMTLDLREGSSQSIKMTKKYQDGRPDTRQLDRARLNIISQTETLAKNKVRRELLGLQGTYTQKELIEKPFVILKLTPIIDMNDPLVRKLTIMQQFNISSELYDQVVKDLPVPGEVPELPPAIEVPALSPATPAQLPAPTPEQVVQLRADLIAEVAQLYARKVRGGRSADKPPLSALNDKALNEIRDMLLARPDLT